MMQIQCYQKMKSATKESLSREKYRQRLKLDNHGTRNGDDRAGKE